MSHSQQAPRAFVTVTVLTALTASLAAAANLALSLPVWVMFVGWIAFFSRGLTTRSTFENLGCVWLGLGIGALAALSIPQLAPSLGLGLALPAVVFAVALVVVALRGLPVLNNLLAYFLGLVTWFAGHQEPSLGGLALLASASAIGSIAGWISHYLPPRLLKPA
jgi:hypothetical protein